MDKKIKTIGMVVAMDKEITPFLSTVGESVGTQTKGGFTVYGYKLEDKTVYLIKSGIGEIYAAAATQVLIGEFGAEVVLNFGVCGALTKDIGVCDTVIVKGVVHYDFDLTGIDDVVIGQYPGYETPIIETTKEFIEISKKAMPNAKEVICASADKFVSDKDIKIRLNTEFGAEVCDMECAAVLLTCNLHGVPTLIIKAVSDGEGGAEEFERCVHAASTAYIGAVKTIVKEL